MKDKIKGIYFNQTLSMVTFRIEESLILIREILTPGRKVMRKLEFKEQKIIRTSWGEVLIWGD